jgi:hypothetical protein
VQAIWGEILITFFLSLDAFILYYHYVGKKFNSGAIILKKVSIKIGQAQKLELEEISTFHIVSFWFDVLCAKNTFLGLSLIVKYLNHWCMHISISCGIKTIGDHILRYLISS